MRELALPTDTIVAISTPPGRSRRAIVRVSGNASFAHVMPLFEPFDGAIRTDRPIAINGWLRIDGEGMRLPVSLYIMPAPRSYTREDVVEIHTVGSPPILEMLLEELTRRGVRLAEPGEFTKRAFINGRIDLSQAEAVLEIIRSRNDAEHRAAMSKLRGVFSREMSSLAEDILDLLSMVEAAIDFSDQDIELISYEKLIERLIGIRERLSAVMKRCRLSPSHDGSVIVVLCGRVNAGKSSLFNRLVEDARAIVTDEPGTTRDVISGTMRLDGMTFTIFDTAGRKVSALRVEKEAMRRAEETAHDADILIYVVDASIPTSSEESQSLRDLSCSSLIVAMNKVDLPLKVSKDEIASMLPDHLRMTAKIVQTCAITGSGVEQLKLHLRELASGLPLLPNATFVKARELQSLRVAYECLERACESAGRDTHEIIALELRDALEAIRGINGHFTPDEVLNRIFEQFCIGK